MNERIKPWQKIFDHLKLIKEELSQIKEANNKIIQVHFDDVKNKSWLILTIIGAFLIVVSTISKTYLVDALESEIDEAIRLRQEVREYDDRAHVFEEKKNQAIKTYLDKDSIDVGDNLELSGHIFNFCSAEYEYIKKVFESAPSDSSDNDTLFTDEWKNRWYSHYDKEMDSVNFWATSMQVNKLIEHSGLLFTQRLILPSLINRMTGSHINNLKKSKARYEKPTNVLLIAGSLLTVISSFGQFKKNKR